MRDNIYRIFDHVSDLGLEIYGSTLPELFENAGFALFDLISDVGNVRAKISHPICVKGESLDLLLRDWLGELLYLFSVEGLLFSTFNVEKIDGNFFQATVKGEKYDPRYHVIKREIKSVTYHKLSVRKEGKRWVATVVFDI
ncbi:MAG: archease [Candidatus Neomarinimicrobiota bacterium]|nr:MAG: archease [Candidatus Neomarinimicrobiota bacterium]